MKMRVASVFGGGGWMASPLLSGGDRCHVIERRVPLLGLCGASAIPQDLDLSQVEALRKETLESVNSTDFDKKVKKKAKPIKKKINMS